MRRFVLVIILLSAAALSACGGAAATPSTAGSSAASSAAASVAASAPASEATGASSAAGSAAGALKPVSIAMGYIPDVQFAMFYVAQAKGYYKDAGLDVMISHGFVTDAVVQVAQGRLTFANAAGDEILLARANKIPVELVFQTYQQYPVAVFSKASAGITAPEGLKGKTVGVPFRSGATYIGLRGILYAAKMSESDINLAEINFTQVEAVRTDKVAAAVGYSNNEPRILEADGVPVNVLKVSDYIQLVSNGIITSENFASTEPDTVRAFVQATAHGLADTIADPDAAFKLTLPFIPELAAERQPQELAKLKESALLWHSPATDANGLGYSDPAAWETTHRFLRDSALLQTDVDVTQAYTNDLRK